MSHPLSLNRPRNTVGRHAPSMPDIASFTAGVKVFSTVAFDVSQQTMPWPKETEQERQAWDHSTVGPVKQLLRRSVDKPASVGAFIGGVRGTREMAWRTWDDEAGKWVQQFEGDWWDEAQRLFDRFVAPDLADIIRVGLECLQVAGRFALVSYPVYATGAIRMDPVDEFGNVLRVPDSVARGADAAAVTKAVDDWRAANDQGLWKTRAIRVGSVKKLDPGSDRDPRLPSFGYALTITDEKNLQIPSWCQIVVVSKDSAGGTAPDPGWVQTAAPEIEAYKAVLQTVSAAIKSQVLADLYMVPREATPYNPGDISESLFGPGLIDKALADKTDEVSAGSYVGAMIAKMTEAALRLGSQGAQVSPSIIDMDAEYIENVKPLKMGRQLDPKLVEMWEAAERHIVNVADSSTDAFFGAGAADGFNRNIGDVTQEQEAADAAARSQWILDRVNTAVISLWLEASKQWPISDWSQTRIFVDASGLAPPQKPSAADVTALVNAGIMSPDGALSILGLPSDVGVQTDEPVEPETVEPEPIETPDVEPELPVTAAAAVEMFDLAKELQAIQTELIDYMVGAADMTLDRAAVKLGNVLRTQEKDQARKPLVAACHDPREIADVLGPDRVRALVAKLDPEQEDQERRLFDEAVVALLVLWRKKAVTAWGRVKRAMVRAGLFASVDEANTVISSERIDELVASSETVLRAGMLTVFRDKLLAPAVNDVETAAIRRVLAGEAVGLSTESVIARAVSSAGGAIVDAATADPIVSAGLIGGPETQRLMSGGTLKRATIVGYEWDYGPAERATPAPWHIDNEGLGVVASLDDFDGFVNDHAGCKCRPVKPVLELR